MKLRWVSLSGPVACDGNTYSAAVCESCRGWLFFCSALSAPVWLSFDESMATSSRTVESMGDNEDEEIVSEHALTTTGNESDLWSKEST